jgi:hypothetical protein
MDKECRLGVWSGELVRDAQLGVRIIRTRSASSELGKG